MGLFTLTLNTNNNYISKTACFHLQAKTLFQTIMDQTILKSYHESHVRHIKLVPHINTVTYIVNFSLVNYYLD